MNRRLLDLQEQLNRSAVASSSMPPVASSIEPDRDVALLIRHNRLKIDALRRALGPEIDCLSWDDLSLLRYVLSFQDVDDAAEAIRKAISWRHENKVGGCMDDCGVNRPRNAGAAGKGCSQRASRLPRKDREFGRVGLSQKGAERRRASAGDASLAVRLAAAAAASEAGRAGGVAQLSQRAGLQVTSKPPQDQAFRPDTKIAREVDRITRKTGRLTKLVRVNDLVNLNLLNQDRGLREKETPVSVFDHLKIRIF